jgi:hypothetical protein
LGHDEPASAIVLHQGNNSESARFWPLAAKNRFPKHQLIQQLARL